MCLMHSLIDSLENEDVLGWNLRQDMSIITSSNSLGKSRILTVMIDADVEQVPFERGYELIFLK